MKPALLTLTPGVLLYARAQHPRRPQSSQSLRSLREGLHHPAPWYFDPRIAQLERDSVFACNWKVVGRLDQVTVPGQFFTIDINNEPRLVVRSNDAKLRAFYNVCRHHAAAVAPEERGCAKQFRCPYHGWTYGNDGALKGMVEFEGVCDFNRADNGLVPGRVGPWRESGFE